MLDSLIVLASAAHEATDASGPVGEIMHKFGVNWKILCAQMFNFAIVAYCLWRFAFKPIIETIDQRQQKIADGLQYAEEVKIKLADVEKQQADTLKEASQEASKTVNAARDQAKAFLDKERADASSQAEELLRKAKDTIELERKKMMVEVQEEIAKLVVNTTEKVLARKLSDKEKTVFGEEAAKEIETAK